MTTKINEARNEMDTNLELITEDMAAVDGAAEKLSETFDEEVAVQEVDETFDDAGADDEDVQAQEMDETFDDAEADDADVQAQEMDETFDDGVADDEDVQAREMDETFDDGVADDEDVQAREVDETFDDGVADDADVQAQESSEAFSDEVVLDAASDASCDNTMPARNKRFRLFNFSRKLMLMCLVPMIIVSVAIISISSNALTNKVESQIEESLQIVTCSLMETYNSLYTGDYSKDASGRLSKGGVRISGETDLLDALKEQTGYESSLTYGDMRYITTVKKEAGGRIQGTNVDKSIYDKILKGKSVFRTDIVIQDITYYAYYQPLYNSDGTVCGMVGSAKPASEVQELMAAAKKQVTTISIVIMLLSMVLILLVASSMARTMRKTKNYLALIADGDLVTQGDPKLLSRQDELGDIYYTSVKLQHEFRKIVTSIKDSVARLSEASDDLTGMAQSTRMTVDEVYNSVGVISQSANTQAEHTSTAADNVSRIGEQIESIADEVDSLTVEATKMAEAEEASEVIIHKLNASNEDTIVSITNVAEQINVTNAAIKRIRRAATMIQSISEETDLLSLNASIEAARAGEAGKGFAVVAEQICKLAEQSNNAAEQIEQLIVQVTDESKKMVEIMDIVKDNVDEQQKKLEETKNQFSQVAVGVETSRTNIEGIRQKMDVLGDSSDAIMGVVENLANISEKNAESTEDTMASALDMTSTMEELEYSSGKLRELASRLDQSLEIFKM